MSTRTQVQVTDGEEKITLYHHTDGYPTYMLPLIKQAWEKYGKGWEGARVGKVASMLCAIDPVIFEPESSNELHGDIEYYYIIDCKDTMHIGTTPIWQVSSYTCDSWSDKKDSDRLHKLGKIAVNSIDDEYAKGLEKRDDDRLL